VPECAFYFCRLLTMYATNIVNRKLETYLETDTRVFV